MILFAWRGARHHYGPWRRNHLTDGDYLAEVKRRSGDPPEEHLKKANNGNQAVETSNAKVRSTQIYHRVSPQTLQK